MFIQSICFDYPGGIGCTKESEHSKVYVVQEKEKKGGKGRFNMKSCLKITRFACPAAQAPLHHHTRHDHDHRHKYDNRNTK
jgi:hypothetical protein